MSKLSIGLHILRDPLCNVDSCIVTANKEIITLNEETVTDNDTSMAELKEDQASGRSKFAGVPTLWCIPQI